MSASFGDTFVNGHRYERQVEWNPVMCVKKLLNQHELSLQPSYSFTTLLIKVGKDGEPRTFLTREETRQQGNSTPM